MTPPVAPPPVAVADALAVPVLEARDLEKRYGKPGPKQVHAVRGLSFRVPEGRCFGLLGPNGAGKSTTIEMLEGLLAPTAGTVRWRGRPLDDTYRQRVGIQFQATALQDFLTVGENLAFFAALYERPRAVEELVRLCRLDDILSRDARKLSGGQRQRLLLAIALVNRPDVLFLDEPTTGLDPQARRHFWDLLEGIKAEGTTVVLTTHYMEEAFRLCEHIAIVDHGRIIAEGTPQTLLAKHFRTSVLELPEAEALKTDLPFKAAQGVAEWQTDDVPGALRQLLDAGADVSRLAVRPPTLEDLFLALTGRAERG